jgi:hypothetical protein
VSQEKIVSARSSLFFKIKSAEGMLDTEKQIHFIKQFFKAPSSARIQCHMSGDGKVAHCCQSAIAFVKASVVALSAVNGINGVIEFFTKKFVCGCIPCRYYCECVKYSNNVYCTATMAMGLEALKMYRSICDQPSFNTVVVELIILAGKFQVSFWNEELAKAVTSFKERPIETEWLRSDTYYHNVVGIVDENKNLNVLESSADFIYPRSSCSDEKSVVAIRLSHWSSNVSNSDFINTYIVSWNGVSLPFNEWIDVQTALESTPNLAVAATENCVDYLGAVYSNTERGQGRIASSNCSDASSLSSSWTKVSKEHESQLHETGSSAIADLFAAGESLSVLISGVYMGNNPCPGVGVARAIRAAAPATRIIAADDVEFSDPVFDEFRLVKKIGSTPLRAGAVRQEQWDVACDLISEYMIPSKEGSHVFYLPVGVY